MKKSLKVFEYNAVFTTDLDGGFSVSVPELPGCFSEGDSFEDAQKNIKEAIELYLKPDLDSKNIYSINPRDQFMTSIKVQLNA
ncbi:MAG: type II toxin-antitoxin system HicB family antitoxin [Patescibacteria group bacterium]